MSKKYDMVVFIGRFQPFHNGHKHIVDTALAAGKQAHIIIGSAVQARDIRNPFTYDERRAVIRENFSEAENSNIFISPLPDRKHSDQEWVKSVQEIVSSTLTGKDKKIALIGYFKDESSYYLKMFPQWDLIEVSEQHDVLNSTDVRNLFFGNKHETNWMMFKSQISTKTYSFLNRFSQTPEYDQLVKEFEHIQHYKKIWSVAPYEPIFVTVDAVVIQSGHVLLIERKNEPGKGLYALPGGFLNPNERLVAASIRELREETKLKVPEPVLYGSIAGKDVFDDPKRSLRGRTITHAFYYKLKDVGELPKVKAADDAKQAFWVPLSEFEKMQDKMFEDHYHIIKHFI